MPDGQTKRTPPARRSPLADVWKTGDYGAVGPDGPGVMMRYGRDLSIVRVHYNSSKPAPLGTCLSEKFGLDIPPPNRSLEHDGVRAVWGGPQQILMVAPDQAHLLTKMVDVADRTGGAAVDQSHGHTLIHIEGANARDLLSKGTGVDLHPDVFGETQVAHTALFHHSVTIERRPGASSYDVHVMRGFAQDLHEHLTAHAAEYGYRLA
jgi:sarcosine oxidase subunit gamma